MKYELVTGSTAAAGGGEVQSGGRQVTLKHSAWRVPSWKRNLALPPVMTISSIGWLVKSYLFNHCFLATALSLESEVVEREAASGDNPCLHLPSLRPAVSKTAQWKRQWILQLLIIGWLSFSVEKAASGDRDPSTLPPPTSHPPPDQLNPKPPTTTCLQTTSDRLSETNSCLFVSKQLCHFFLIVFLECAGLIWIFHNMKRRNSSSWREKWILSITRWSFEENRQKMFHTFSPSPIFGPFLVLHHQWKLTTPGCM